MARKRTGGEKVGAVGVGVRAVRHGVLFPAADQINAEALRQRARVQAYRASKALYAQRYQELEQAARPAKDVFQEMTGLPAKVTHYEAGSGPMSMRGHMRRLKTDYARIQGQESRLARRRSVLLKVGKVTKAVRRGTGLPGIVLGEMLDPAVAGAGEEEYVKQHARAYRAKLRVARR